MEDPKRATHNVGTRLLFENHRVRVWEMRLAPGESSERHLHENDYLFVNLERARLLLHTEHGDPEPSQAEPSQVVYTEVGTGITHRLENVGDSEHYEILVELKGPSRSVTSQRPETNR